MPPLPLLAISVAVALIGLERLWPARRDAGQPLLNMGLWTFRHLSQFATVPLLGAAAAALAKDAGVPGLHIDRWPTVWAVIAFVVAMDLGEYLFHRAQHAIPFLWRMHSLHHSDPCMSALTTERHFWADAYLKAVTVWLVVGVLLAPPPVAFGLYGLISTYNFFTHANLRVNFGPLSWLINSPAYHRLHHSKTPEHHGANFAALFPIFDVILGSYVRPRTYPETGLDQRPADIGDMLLWPLKLRSLADRAEAA